MTNFRMLLQHKIKAIRFVLTLLLSFLFLNNTQCKKYSGKVVLVKGGLFQFGHKGKIKDFNGNDIPTPPGNGTKGFWQAVYVDDFYIGKYEVTNKEYMEFLNEYGSDTIKDGIYQGKKMIASSKEYLHKKVDNKWFIPKEYESYPVQGVSWFGAYTFCKYYGGTLPTEVEWEYAASGGQKSKGYKYAGSNELNKVAW